MLAPSSSPSAPTIVNKTLTSITINWTYPNISDVHGYVIYASSLVDDYMLLSVNGCAVCQTMLVIHKLSPGTTYNITVRAYQDILGPPSDVLIVATLDG